MHYGKTVVIGLITEIAPDYWVVRILPMDTLRRGVSVRQGGVKLWVISSSMLSSLQFKTHEMFVSVILLSSKHRMQNSECVIGGKKNSSIAFM